MLRLNEVLDNSIKSNPWLIFGIRNKLFNLTSLANFLKPSLEVKLKKEVSVSSILMALSRLQKRFDVQKSLLVDFKIKNLTLNLNLVVFSFYKSPKLDQLMVQFYKKMLSRNEFVNLTEGVTEFNIVFEDKFENEFLDLLGKNFKYRQDNVAAVVLKFAKDYSNCPGLLMSVIEKMFVQNVNLVEVSSTFTELILYVNQAQSKLAFDTLYSFLE
jgi:hypothetical protein